MTRPLGGTRVIIAGAGLAGLTAARELSRRGAHVRVFEARNRLGGRVWTSRDAPLAPFHGELGGEFVDQDHHAIRALCREFGLRLKPILLRGFGLVIGDGRRVKVFDSQRSLWQKYSAVFEARARALSDVDADWVSSIAGVMARQSVNDVLDAAGASRTVRAHAEAFRNFWVADPGQLSALVAAAQVLDGDPSSTAMYHIVGGNDQLVDGLVKAAKCEIARRHIIRRVDCSDDGVRVQVESASGRLTTARADYVVMAVPEAIIDTIGFSPALPPAQQQAFKSLETGPATKAILRYSSPWWRRPGKPRAYGSNLAIGAVWDGGEAQPGAAILTMLGGGSASAALQRLLARGDVAGLAEQLRWLGRPHEVPQVHSVSWEKDPWARGAYAYFSPRFDPALRPLLARAAGRVFFAGSYTSREHQGYMNGAVESGRRVADEIAAASTL
jgi:monoamine oxidase